MASIQHDFIVESIARKIRLAKYTVCYLDGHFQDVCNMKPDIPPKILRHRPDVIGVHKNRSFIIGEAKTKNDILSKRTKHQIIDFLEIVAQGKNNKLIIGIPMDAKEILNSVLKTLEVIDHPQLDIIFIPNALLPKEDEIYL